MLELAAIFHHQYGLRVTGIDYSPNGCEMTRAILRRDGAPGDVHHDDAFNPPTHLLGAFDVVVSMGFVEHFEDTEGCARALAAFARPGGRVLTTLPNLAGMIGRYQRYLDRTVYEKHVPLRREEVERGMEAAGLDVLDCKYVGLLDFHVNNMNSGGDAAFKRTTWKALMRTSRFLWSLEGSAIKMPINRSTASAIVCSARTPSSTSPALTH